MSLRRLALAVALAAVLAPALLAAGCHEDVTLGTDPAPFCQDKPCGEACPAPAATMAPGPFACDDQGRCAPGPASCMPPPDPCHGLHCGLPCAPGCAPGGDGGCPPPPMPMACDMAGHCLPTNVVGCMGMPPGGPCIGKKCNDPCKLCNPADPMCMEGPMPTACDPSGICVMAPVSCP